MRRWLSAVAAVEPQVWGQLLQIGDLEAVQEAGVLGWEDEATEKIWKIYGKHMEKHPKGYDIR